MLSEMTAGILNTFEGIYLVSPKVTFTKHLKSYFLLKSAKPGLLSDLQEDRVESPEFISPYL